MQILTDSLAQAAKSHMQVFEAPATRVERAENIWRVKAGETWIPGDDLVLACPAHVSSALLETAARSLASELASIPYSSAILVTFLFDRGDLAHSLDGFGFLVPRSERRSVAAATWAHVKFPPKARNDLAIVRAFIVGPEATLLLRSSHDELVRLALSELDRLAGVTAKPLRSLVHVWPDSMPQYVVGHETRRNRIRGALAEIPGLYLTGNAYEGVGVPDCIRLAKETAKRIVESIRPANTHRISESPQPLT